MKKCHIHRDFWHSALTLAVVAGSVPGKAPVRAVIGPPFGVGVGLVSDARLSRRNMHTAQRDQI
ncbi:MAG: hypothetical protein CML66_02575 [Rhodobacteraceae bacterium]|nr:hypothetical protein [Paracoccaceae bacterium]MAY48159.1 hypothetical protein [Paracoccaceae bacterium]